MHERFTAAEVRALRADHPGVIVLAHPECPPEVVAEADFAGSTADMSNYVGREQAGAGRAAHRMLDGDNVSVRSSGGRIRPPVQSLPAHEAHHAAEDPPRAGDDDARGDDRPGHRRARPPGGRAHAGGVAAMGIPPLPGVMIEPLVRAALLEDLGRAGDITTDAIVPAELRTETALVARQTGVVAGLDFALMPPSA